MARAPPRVLCWAHACPLRAPGGPEASVHVLRALQHRLLDGPCRELKMFSEKVALGYLPWVPPGTCLPSTGNRGSVPSKDLGVAHHRRCSTVDRWTLTGIPKDRQWGFNFRATVIFKNLQINKSHFHVSGCARRLGVSLSWAPTISSYGTRSSWFLLPAPGTHICNGCVEEGKNCSVSRCNII